MYRTIKSRAHDEANRITHPKCQCGARLNPRNTWVYVNKFNKLVPICVQCLDIIAHALSNDELALFVGDQ